jgi:SagB-type dehydrogenase family enzyme
MENPTASRDMMKSVFATESPDWQSDKDRGVAPPPLQKAPQTGSRIVELPPIDGTSSVPRRDVLELIMTRRSRRRFGEAPLKLSDLAFLLWATAGVQRVVGDNICTMRTVPSGGARHPYETYLSVREAEGLEAGLWRYLPLSHQIELIRAEADLPARLVPVCANQAFLAEAAVTFIWAAVPYRAEWAYGAASAKAMLIDAGHIAQNLYLAAEALNLGTCAIAAYDQAKLDALLGLDGQDEFAVYLAPVGAKKRGK